MKNIIHWCKPKKMWTSHTYKTCEKSPVILVNGEWYAETKPLKKDNPRGWIVTNHDSVIVNPSEDILLSFNKREKLLYNKEKVEFSHIKGEYLLFDKEGCFILSPKE